jgi:polyhydroxybutyrate depolymerase
MKRLRFLLFTLLACLVLSTFSSAQTTESRYPEAVRYVVARGLVQGNNNLRLQENVTRAELAVIAYRLYGAARPGEVRCFSDVATDAWYKTAVCSLAGQNIVSGFEDGTFRPTQTVQGAEVLKIIMSAFNVEVDSEEASPWYTPYVQLASELGLPFVEPTNPVTRDTLIQFIFGLYKLRATQQNVALSSSGCGVSSELLSAITSSGVTRSVITDLPENYDPNTTHDIIFAFHGRTSDNAQVQRYYDLDAEGLETSNDTIFVYPAALSDGGGFTWANAENTVDTQLFDDLLETYASNYCVDLASVYVVGHSLGASYTTSLGCLRGDRIRAVAALGGGISANTCTSKIAAMVLHNPDDNLVPISEGERARDTFLAQNALPLEPVPTEPSDFNCNRYGSEETLYPVVWCLQPFSDSFNGEYYPHTWPQGAGPAIMNFFAEL